MTSVLITSDSHGLTKELDAMKEKHDVDLYIHCGDSELEFDAAELSAYYKVSGNCDFDTRYPDEEVLDLNGLRFFVTHGHLHQVKGNLTNLSYAAEEQEANIVCFGHTHIAGAEKIGNQLFINPGSIRMPRNRVEKTYAILSWESSNQVQVDFYTLDSGKVEGMSYQVSL
ncbi:metallophosphoesterase [Oceanobacillus sp. J11TS1]|uniref:metallophosphoesterase n=1 Tax=Oceanobacillus sp. J11TS1 TaxID=2807191 RepID=UPI001B17AF01|nr:metallophosphoesterase [Oceanobacillus sp. J11TS1]GIO21764.1 phosphoesterase [Oceanobacillus sp. J11TS1]